MNLTSNMKGKEVVLDSSIDDKFIENVKSIALNKDEKKVIKIVFTPQHGTSSKIGQRLLKELGYEMYPVVEQCTNDPDFSETLSPNPENKEAYVKAKRLAPSSARDSWCKPCLLRVDSGVSSVFLNKLAAWLYVVAHKH